jgi:probable rRNA maturation factor
MKKLKSNKLNLNKLCLHLQKATSHSDSLPLRKEFIQWVKLALQAANPPTLQNYEEIALTIRLADEEESARLNEQYLHKKGPTNVLSFPSAPIGIEDQIYYLGDLLFCVPLVLKEATEQKKPSLAHWAHLTIHGILHLLGYNHIEEKEAVLMEKLEIEALKHLGFENPYA